MAVRVVAAALVALLAGSATGCAACPETGWVPRVPEARHEGVPLFGDADCAPGAPDCNVCAPDVVGQFSSGVWRGHIQTWSFAEPGMADVAPHRAYSPLHGHAQGFVRLNVAPEAYALVHSQDGRRLASLSFVARRGASLQLESLYRLGVARGHTSGAFVLGRYVGLIDVPRGLTLIDGHAALEHRPLAALHLELWHPDEGAGFMKSPRAHGLSDWSGGVAIAKLAADGYLLIANEGGASSGDSHLFELAPFPGLSQPGKLRAREIGEASFPVAPLICAEHHRSENVALITECGTGSLFAVHVGSNDNVRFGDTEVGGYQTFWRLSRVVVIDGHASLEPVGVYLRAAHLRYCHGRSAGSAFVDPDTRRINLLCHERARGNGKKGPWRFWSAETESDTSLSVTARP